MTAERREDGPRLTAEQALAWFAEPRYSVTDLQRAWAEGGAAALAAAPPPERPAIDIERLARAIADHDDICSRMAIPECADKIAAEYDQLSHVPAP